jgi:hypothetical protein
MRNRIFLKSSNAPFNDIRELATIIDNPSLMYMLFQGFQRGNGQQNKDSYGRAVGELVD